MLEITVREIRGKCPVHKTDDRIVIDGPRLVLEETDAVCVHALSTILHYVPALEKGVDPVTLGLTKEKGSAYMQCVDPGEPYTKGGTVIFECRMTS
ncbi:MAG: TIGR04076 family protein [Thermoplasmata archaeon]